MQRGTRVRLLSGPMGCLQDEHGSRFADKTLTKGDEAEYWGAHNQLPEWELLKTDDGYYCPVHITAIEVVQ